MSKKKNKGVVMDLGSLLGGKADLPSAPKEREKEADVKGGWDSYEGRGAEGERGERRPKREERVEQPSIAMGQSNWRGNTVSAAREPSSGERGGYGERGGDREDRRDRPEREPDSYDAKYGDKRAGGRGRGFGDGERPPREPDSYDAKYGDKRAGGPRGEFSAPSTRQPLNLQKRTLPIDPVVVTPIVDVKKGSAPSSPSSKPNPFGSARPGAATKDPFLATEDKLKKAEVPTESESAPAKTEVSWRRGEALGEGSSGDSRNFSSKFGKRDDGLPANRFSRDGPSRDAPSSGVRENGRWAAPSREGDGSSSRFGGDRDGGSRFNSSREDGGSSRFGGDRDGGSRFNAGREDGGSNRFGGDRDGRFSSSRDAQPREREPMPTNSRWAALSASDAPDRFAGGRTKPEASKRTEGGMNSTNEPMPTNSRWNPSSDAKPSSDNLKAEAPKVEEKPSLEELKRLAREKNEAARASGKFVGVPGVSNKTTSSASVSSPSSASSRRSADEVQKLIAAAGSLSLDDIKKQAMTGDERMDEKLSKKVESIIRDFYESPDMKETLVAFKELKIENYALVVKAIINEVFDHGEKKAEAAANFINAIFVDKLLSSEKALLGLQIIKNMINDIALDYITAPKVFLTIEKSLLASRVINIATVLPPADFEWWEIKSATKVAVPVAPTISAEEVDKVLSLLKSDKKGKALLQFAKEGTLPSPLALIAGVIESLMGGGAASDPLSLLQPDAELDQNVYYFTQFKASEWGKLMSGVLKKTTLEQQIFVLTEVDKLAADFNYPKEGGASFVESFFISLYDYEIMGDEPFIAYKSIAQGECFNQLIGWISWLESQEEEEEEEA